MVVIGAGECGARAVLALRECGWSGSVTLIGAESAEPYERPPLSKAIMTATDPLPSNTICDAEALRAADVAFIRGVAATEIDRVRHELLLADGSRVQYDRLLLATGATARHLPGPSEIHHLRTYADALALRERLLPGARICVIGGGFIGLELASSAVARGCVVTVIEVAAMLMARVVPAEIATLLADRHAAAGVEIRRGTQVVGIEHAGEIWHLTLSTGERILCDTMVAGIGAVPESTLAEKAGLDIENGIRVDTRLATSDPDIFAAGDCCSFPHPLYDGRRIRLESWRNAQDQGTAAAASMLGDITPFSAVPWFWSDQHDLTLQIAGLPDAAVRELTRHRPDGVAIRFGLGKDGRLLAASAVGPGNSVAKDVRLAELLIANRAAPPAAALADPAVSLKSLLKSNTRPQCAAQSE
jgi:3-phenylpropionate/trans-cinnamate dioxygenase ferredoxin reductase subunit